MAGYTRYARSVHETLDIPNCIAVVGCKFSFTFDNETFTFTGASSSFHPSFYFNIGNGSMDQWQNYLKQAIEKDVINKLGKKIKV